MENKSTATLFIIFLICSLNISKAVASPPWQSLHAGIDYRVLSPGQLSPFAQLHIFKLDLGLTTLHFCPNPDNKTTVKQNASVNDALITVNGGFFSPDYKPLGLRVRQGKILSPIKKISWWGIFYIKNRKAHLVSLKQYRHTKRVSFAIQAGPRLIINGRIPKLKKGMAERTALGITKTGKVIIVVSEHTSLSTSYLAQLMRDELGCVYAINLDGGGSTQLFAHIGDFKRHIHGFSRIPDPLCVYPT